MAGGCFFWVISRLQADGTADKQRFSNTRDWKQNFAKDKFSEVQEREPCIVRIAVLLVSLAFFNEILQVLMQDAAFSFANRCKYVL